MCFASLEVIGPAACPIMTRHPSPKAQLPPPELTPEDIAALTPFLRILLEWHLRATAETTDPVSHTESACLDVAFSKVLK